MSASDIDQLLHDADRKVMGLDMARMMGDTVSAAKLEREAKELYQAALDADPDMKDSAWKEDGNRDDRWLLRNGFKRIAAYNS